MLMSGKSMRIGLVLIGLLLLVIGAGTKHPNVTLAGDFVFPIGLIWSGFSEDEVNVPLRVTMLAVGGVFVIAAFAGMGVNLASLLGR